MVVHACAENKVDPFLSFSRPAVSSHLCRPTLFVSPTVNNLRKKELLEPHIYHHAEQDHMSDPVPSSASNYLILL
jgi:hypothetical protein